MRLVEGVYFTIAVLLFLVTVRKRKSDGKVPFWEHLPLFFAIAFVACAFWPFTMLACILSEEEEF